MSKLKLLSARELEKILLQLGFIKVRQNGSHSFYKHPDGRTTILSFHGNKDISCLVTYAILREIGISIDEYNDLV